MKEEHQELVRKIFNSRKENGCILTPRECDILVHHLLAYGKLAGSIEKPGMTTLAEETAP